jgi:hypothetical protein
MTHPFLVNKGWAGGEEEEHAFLRRLVTRGSVRFVSRFPPQEELRAP